MSFSATISLTSAGVDATLFSIYSDVDGYVAPFETGITRTAILAGITSTNVPDGTNTCKVVANCGGYVLMPINDPYIYVYNRCGTEDNYYNVGITTLKAEDAVANCYQNIDEGLLSAMVAAYPGLTELTTLISSSCECV